MFYVDLFEFPQQAMINIWVYSDYVYFVVVLEFYQQNTNNKMKKNNVKHLASISTQTIWIGKQQFFFWIRKTISSYWVTVAFIPPIIKREHFWTFYFSESTIAGI